MKNLLKRATLVVAMMLVTSASILLVGCGEEKTHTHSLTKVDAVEATCETTGNIEYWYCADCGRYYSDEDATIEISQEDTVVAATGHILTHYVRVEATCETAGNIEYWYCADCGKYFSDAEGTVVINQEDTVIAATGHTLTHYVRVEASCETAGNIEYWYCADCGKYFSDEEATVVINQEDTVIPAGHTYGETLTYSDGSWYKTCTMCEGNISDGKVAVTEDYADYTFLADSSDALTSALALGGSIKLTANIGDESSSVTFGVSSGITATLDLNGYSITTTASIAITVNDGATLTIKDSGNNSSATVSATNVALKNVSGGTLSIDGGTFTAGRYAVQNNGNLTVNGGTLTATNSSATSYGIVVNSGSDITINGGTIYGGTYGIFFNGDSTTLTYDATVTINDGNISGGNGYISGSGGAIYQAFGTLTINGGKIENTTSGIIMFGFNSEKYTTLTINGGMISSVNNSAIKTNGDTDCGYVNIYIYGGTITSTNELAIYLPATVGITVISGTDDSPVTISGTTGVEIRAGSLTISGNVSITATGEFSESANGSGSTIIGAAVAISQHTTNKAITVVINGGTFSGAYAVYEKDLQDTTYENIIITITGGTFSGSVASNSTYTEDEANYSVLSITGGTYTTDVSTYVASGYTCSSNDGDSTYTVAQTNNEG